MKRVRVTISLPKELLKGVDCARGPMTRAAFFEAAVWAYLNQSLLESGRKPGIAAGTRVLKAVRKKAVSKDALAELDRMRKDHSDRSLAEMARDPQVRSERAAISRAEQEPTDLAERLRALPGVAWNGKVLSGISKPVRLRGKGPSAAEMILEGRGIGDPLGKEVQEGHAKKVRKKRRVDEALDTLTG